MSLTPLLAHPNQLLSDHLSGAATLAESFAAWFGAGGHGRLAGLLHDLGKAEDVFKARMEAIKAGKPDPGDKQPHAHHGAALAIAQDHWPIAFAINGHHAGLHDRHDLDSMRGKRTEYVERAKMCMAKLQAEGFSAIPESFGDLLPECLARLSDNPQQQMLVVEIFTRFLFSALVDADRLDTEANDPDARRAAIDRKAWREFDAAALLGQVEQAIADKHRDPAELTGREAQVQRVRDEVADLCRTGGDHEGNMSRGLFSLTVPTGGGKTLASMLFALSHAQAHAQEEPAPGGATRKPIRRIIVVIPYLSIIQQTAEVLKDVFHHTEDAPVVLEHHSNAADPVLDEKKVATGKGSDYSRARSLRQLAAENWDAPIIVTTSVQFFDSLFSRSPADARKLHNIAQSVVIFDEVQTFPPHLLPSILDVLGELTCPDRPYGCSAVFCTATQPALGYDENEFPAGLKNVRPIVPQKTTEGHFSALKRVEYSGCSPSRFERPP